MQYILGNSIMQGYAEREVHKYMILNKKPPVVNVNKTNDYVFLASSKTKGFLMSLIDYFANLFNRYIILLSSE